MDLGGSVVCHRLVVTEERLISAVASHDPRSLREAPIKTGAGIGGNAGHRETQLSLDSYYFTALEV
jgi:hypothetical protein